MGKRKIVGAAAEKRVAAHLRGEGYDILAMNFSCNYGEIDIIAKKDGVIVFVEVKYRGSDSYGMPAEAVNYRKQRCLSESAAFYMYRQGYMSDVPCRFDVAEVSEMNIHMIENAFPYRGRFY